MQLKEIGMIEDTAEIINVAGLHARAASKMVETTSSFASDVKIGHNKMVDGKSILALMMLAATKGTIIKIVVDGSDENAAMTAIQTLIADRFGEPQ